MNGAAKYLIYLPAIIFPWAALAALAYVARDIFMKIPGAHLCLMWYILAGAVIWFAKNTNGEVKP